jgi:hypothetical protein
MFFSFFLSNKSIAQEVFSCGSTSNNVTHNEHKPMGNCPIDINDIMSNCKQIYLKVNFYLFVANDCTGSFEVNNLPAPWSQDAAYFESNQVDNL